MTIPQRHEIEARKAELERKLAARTGKSGFAGNCEAIKVEVARLDALLLTAAP